MNLSSKYFKILREHIEELQYKNLLINKGVLLNDRPINLKFLNKDSEDSKDIKNIEDTYIEDYNYLRYLHNSGFECNQKTALSACTKGNLKCIRFAFIEGFLSDVKECLTEVEKQIDNLQKSIEILNQSNCYYHLQKYKECFEFLSTCKIN
jgi:hypothetical protein